MRREDWDRRYEGSELLWTAEPNRFLVEEVQALTPARALDLGSGEGRNAVWLAEQGWRVTAVDFSQVGLAKAQRLAARRGVSVEWVLADVAEWQPASTFDLVVVAYLQVPAALRRRVWPRAAGAVAPGGTLLVIAHHPDNLYAGWGGPRSLEVLYGPDEVVGALTGFTVARADRVERPVTVESGEEAVALDLLVRATRGE